MPETSHENSAELPSAASTSEGRLTKSGACIRGCLEAFGPAVGDEIITYYITTNIKGSIRTSLWYKSKLLQQF